MGSSSETDNDTLDVPTSTRRRRRKLSSAGKVSGTEFFTAVFDISGSEWEDLVPAVRGTCLREAISGVCERRGVDVESIEVFLDNNKTPLPLLTSETSWLGGRTLKIRGKDESRSPVRGGGRGSITAPTSRKTSAVSSFKIFQFWTLDPHWEGHLWRKIIHFLFQSKLDKYFFIFPLLNFVRLHIIPLILRRDG